MAGFNLDIGANTKQFQSGVKDMEKSLDAVSDSLDDLTKESQRATDKTQDGFDDAARGVKGTDTAVDRLADSFGDLSRKTAKVADNDFPNLSKKGEKALFHVGESAGEFKDEALANFSEVTSSFDGSMSSIVDLAQGTFGGLAAAGGVIGLAAGALAGVIGGVFTSMSQSADENAAKTEQRISDMYQDMIESGNDFVSQDLVSKALQDIISDTGKLAAARKTAADTGISVQTELRAEAGDHDALAAAMAAATQQYEALRDRADDVVKAGGTVSGELQGQVSAAHDLVLKYQDLQANTDSAAAKARLYRQAITDTAASMLGAGQQTAGLNAQLSKIPSSKTVKVNVEAFTATAEAKLRALASRPLSIIVDAHTRAGDRVF